MRKTLLIYVISTSVKKIARTSTATSYRSYTIVKKEIIIKSDSVIKHTNDQSYPGAATEDLIDYIKLNALKKPDMVTIHSGSNGILITVITLRILESEI